MYDLLQQTTPVPRLDLEQTVETLCLEIGAATTIYSCRRALPHGRCLILDPNPVEATAGLSSRKNFLLPTALEVGAAHGLNQVGFNLTRCACHLVGASNPVFCAVLPTPILIPSLAIDSGENGRAPDRWYPVRI